MPEAYAQQLPGLSKLADLVKSLDPQSEAFAVAVKQQIAALTAGLNSLQQSLRNLQTSKYAEWNYSGTDLEAGSVGDTKIDRTTDPLKVKDADIDRLTASKVQIRDADIDRATANKLKVVDADIDSLNASKVNAGTLAAARFSATVAYITTAAQVQDATITNAKIVSLNADKLTAGTIDAARLSTAVAYITNSAQIADAIITSAKIASLAVDKITGWSGSTITLSANLTFAGNYYINCYSFKANASSFETYVLGGGMKITRGDGWLFNSDTLYIGGDLIVGYVAAPGDPPPLSYYGITSEGDGSFKDVLATGVVKVDDLQVLTSRQSAISAPSGGGTQDAEARTAIGSILTVLRTHGLIAT